ncbi:MAG: signal peptidase II [Candidatus Limnocylindria bacterium]
MEAARDRDPSLRAVLVLVGTALPIYVADQLAKAAVAAAVGLGERIDVLGDMVQLWHVRNAGAAFSLFQGATWLFLVVSGAALAMVAWFHVSLRGRGLWLQAVLGMILAGALGNLTDRLRDGYVVDFISVGIGDLRWPTFNVADSSVVLGILILVGYLSLADRRTGQREPA